MDIQSKEFTGLLGRDLTEEEREQIAALFFILQRNFWSSLSVISQILVGVKPNRNSASYNQE